MTQYNAISVSVSTSKSLEGCFALSDTYHQLVAY